MILHLLIYNLIPLVLSFAIGHYTIPKIVFISKKKRLFDRVDARKSHTNKISRLGGIAFFPAIFISITVCLVILTNTFGYSTVSGIIDILSQLSALFLGLVLLYFTGMADDLIGVNFKKKLVSQIVSIVFLMYAGLRMTTLDGVFGIEAMPDYVSMPLTLIIAVAIINSINLIDGIDGLCSSIAIAIITPISIWLLINNHYIESIVAFSVIGTLVSFLRYNITKGKFKLFMGDTGSLIVGFCISYLMLSFIKNNEITSHEFEIKNYFLFAISLVFVPLIDATRVFANRMAHHKSPFFPDRTHLHHYIIDKGYKHITATIIMVLIVVSIYSINFLLSFFIDSSTILLCLLFIYGLSIMYVFPLVLLPKRNKK